MRTLPSQQSMKDQTADWSDFLGRTADHVGIELIGKFLMGKRVLITGAGGYIGSALARFLSKVSLERLVLLDQAEAGMFELLGALDEARDSTSCAVLIGDICDRVLLREIFELYRPEIVFHAAAYKHVTLMESNPFAAARNNILGTYYLLEAATKALAAQVIIVSTDKAVDPTGMMGATKRIVELMAMADKSATQIKAVRLANVLGSTGSVGPIFEKQIARGGRIQVTDRRCTRYFLTVHEVVHRLMSALSINSSATILAAKAGEPFLIEELAKFLNPKISVHLGEIAVDYIGLRAGEKLIESMIGVDEESYPSAIAELDYVESGIHLPVDSLDRAIIDIEQAVTVRDINALLASFKQLLPNYRFLSKSNLDATGEPAETSS